MNIAEIAKIAQVSKAAVSLALNNRPGVSEETRKRILEVVKNCGYKHKSMVDTHITTASQSTGNFIRLVGCMKEDLVSEQYQSSSFFLEIIRSIERNARKEGIALVISNIGTEDYVDTLTDLEQDHQSLGIILLGTNLSASETEEIVKVHPKCVIIDTLHEQLNADFVVMDNVMGGFSAAKYLVEELKHRQIGYAQSIQRVTNFRSRERGFFMALEQLAITISPNFRYELDSDIAKAQEEFHEILLKSKDIPSAIFCECDYTAIGVIRALQERGFRVPEDVSVMGFDNVSEAAFVTPSLTTIAVPRDKIGELAVSHILNLKEFPESTYVKTLVNTAIVKRNSCISR